MNEGELTIFFGDMENPVSGSCQALNDGFCFFERNGFKPVVEFDQQLVDLNTGVQQIVDHLVLGGFDVHFQNIDMSETVVRHKGRDSSDNDLDGLRLVATFVNKGHHRGGTVPFFTDSRIEVQRSVLAANGTGVKMELRWGLLFVEPFDPSGSWIEGMNGAIEAVDHGGVEADVVGNAE